MLDLTNPNSIQSTMGNALPIGIHVTMVSGNKKTGPITTTRTQSGTCPSTCRLLQEGACYDLGGRSRLHRDKIDQGAYHLYSHEQFFGLMACFTRVWRWASGGDLPNDPRTPCHGQTINKAFLVRMVRKAQSLGQVPIIYTHKPIFNVSNAYERNKRAIRAAMKAAPKIAINVSCDTLAQVDRASRMGFSTTVTLPEDAPARLVTKGGQVIKGCPQQLSKSGRRFTCAEHCKSRNGLPICADPNRGFTVGFYTHGVKRKSYSERLKIWNQ